MEALTAWEKSWAGGPEGEPILISGRHLDRRIQYRLEKALREASDLWDTQRLALRSTYPIVEYEGPKDIREPHQYYASLADELPLHEWAVERANIHSRLVAMRNNMFREILTRSSGYSEKRVKKKVGFLDWPRSLTEDDWNSIKEKVHFVPPLMLDRVAATQPFRDKASDGSNPSNDWMLQGGVQSSRKEANDDKHERNSELALNLTCPSVIANYSFTYIDHWQRDHRSSPGDGKPIFEIRAEDDRSNPVLVYEVMAHLVMPNPSRETRGELPWALASGRLWYQLLENLWMFHVVLAGRGVASAIVDSLLEKFDNFWGSGDMRYERSPEGVWIPVEAPNPFRELHELAQEANQWLSSFDQD